MGYETTFHLPHPLNAGALLSAAVFLFPGTAGSIFDLYGATATQALARG